MQLWKLLKFGAHESVRPAFLPGCSHCGLPAPDPCFHEESGEQRAFCCRACRQVYLLTQEMERFGVLETQGPGPVE